MREIKFRAWSKETGMWGWEELLSSPKENKLQTIGKTTDFKSVMQFTGLLDKNGKEIYEGDIFKVANNRVYSVRFCSQEEHDYEQICSCFVLDGISVFPFDDYALKNGEVIGNIYENPELLEAK